MADLTCPFCNEDNFDAIGLKQHLQRGWCDAYNETPNTDRPEPVKPLTDCVRVFVGVDPATDPPTVHINPRGVEVPRG